MRKTQVPVLPLLLVLLLAACAPTVAPAPQGPSPAAAAPAPAAAVPLAAPVSLAQPAWQEQWEKTVADAKKEGTVFILFTAGADLRASVQKGFKNAYGITMEGITGRGADLIPKILAERRANLYLSDAGLMGYNSILAQLKPAGVLDSFDRMFILPDVTDPATVKKVWYQGTLPWVDKDHTIFKLCLQPGTLLVVNSNLVKPDEIKSYRDLLDPKWKDKLVVNDPTVAGPGQLGLQGVLELMGEDFVRELVATRPIIMRDQRQMMEWLAHGKVSIVVAPQPVSIEEFLKIGASIKLVIPKEGVYLSSGASGVHVYKNAPHVNALKVFLNWITSKEGQDIWAPGAGFESLRLDVSTAHIRPEMKRQEGVKYVDLSTEEASTVRSEVAAKKAKEIFGPLLK